LRCFVVVRDRLVELAPAFVDLSAYPVGDAKVRIEIERTLYLLKRIVGMSCGMQRAPENRVDDERQWIKIVRAPQFSDRLLEAAQGTEAFRRTIDERRRNLDLKRRRV
jgi:hypothetical protein